MSILWVNTYITAYSKWRFKLGIGTQSFAYRRMIVCV